MTAPGQIGRAPAKIRFYRPLVRVLRLGGAFVCAVAVIGSMGRTVADVQVPASPKTIIELQPFRHTQSVEFSVPGDQGPDGGGEATLTNLNPQINAWFVLTIRWARSGNSETYHLENPVRQAQRLSIDADHPNGIRIFSGGSETDCDLWGGGKAALQRAQRSDLPYAPLCEDRLYLRNAVPGTYTHLERVTNFLRDHVWGGEQIVGFVKQEFFGDAFIETGSAGAASLPGVPDVSPPGLRAAQIGDAYSRQAVMPEGLGIDVGQRASGLLLGRWYAARDAAGVYVSVIKPQAMVTPLSNADRRSVNELDSVEAGALDYLVALDLQRFDLGFALGTDHPRVGWSERVLDSVRDPKLPGPDGISSPSPLVVNGMVNPPTVARAAATFAGGFKREHGAFRYGALAEQNHGSHYGFIQEGTVFSKLQPQLATLLVYDDETVGMKTWTAADDASLAHIRYARQNGVPLIEYDQKTGASAAGALVNSWGPGNWSGSSEEHLRTVRSGVCLLSTSTARFLVYGYFSTATPSAMARVFLAYGCRYAMHLDMNALEHTYFALYTHRDGRIVVQHLIEGMAEVDRKGGDELAPRFLSFPDDRDFFYLTEKR